MPFDGLASAIGREIRSARLHIPRRHTAGRKVRHRGPSHQGADLAAFGVPPSIEGGVCTPGASTFDSYSQVDFKRDGKPRLMAASGPEPEAGGRLSTAGEMAARFHRRQLV